MKYSTLNAIRGLFTSIGIIYFFILPVYIPIRALGIEIQSYEKVLINSLDLILYFSQITLLLACNGILLSMFFEFISKRLFEDDSLIIYWYRIIAVLYSCFFIATSYFVLTPENIYQLYGWSGAHYFIISFFQLLIRSEISQNKNNKISVVQANNYFGIVLNVSGVIALAIFSCLYSNDFSDHYTNYCVGLELLFFIYLMFIRKYYLSFALIINKYSVKKILTYCFFATLALFIASIVSILFMLSGCFGAIVILVFIGYLYSKLQKEVERSDLKLIINVGMGYGLVLAALTGSVLAYFVKLHSANMDFFNYAYSFEPLFSIIIGVVFSWYLLKRNIESSKTALSNSIFILNCTVPIILGFYIFAYIKYGFLLQSLFIVFGIFAYLEYMSLFYVRQIAQQCEYKELNGAKLTNFNSVVLNGLSPALLYLLIFAFSKFTVLDLSQLLIASLMILTFISAVINFRQKYLMNYEKK